MKIFFDTTPLSTGHQGRGIGMYTKNLITALKKHQYVGVQSGDAVAGGYECDLVHYPYFDFFFNTLPLKKITKTVITIHDTIPLIFKQQVPPGIKGTFRFYLQWLALRSVDAIITDSQNSKVDIEKYLHIKPDKIFVTPLAVDQDFAEKMTGKHLSKPAKLPKKYLLYVGDINYNKNVPSLIRAFSQVSQEVDLVIVSRALNNAHLPESKAIIHELSHSPRKGRIHLLSNVEANDLPAIYQHAWFYIQPSLYEGFGLPILEAFTSKVPVLSSQTASLPQVAGDAAIYFDPSDSSSIMQAINQAMSLTDREREKYIQKGTKQNQKFSWDQTARETIDVYKKVLLS